GDDRRRRHPTIPLDLSGLGDGTLTASATETDVLGNATDAAGASTLKDTGGPGGSLTVNSQFGTFVYTNKPALSLQLAFADALTGVTQMQLSTDGVAF